MEKWPVASCNTSLVHRNKHGVFLRKRTSFRWHSKLKVNYCIRSTYCFSHRYFMWDFGERESGDLYPIDVCCCVSSSIESARLNRVMVLSALKMCGPKTITCECSRSSYHTDISTSTSISWSFYEALKKGSCINIIVCVSINWLQKSLCNKAYTVPPSPLNAASYATNIEPQSPLCGINECRGGMCETSKQTTSGADDGSTFLSFSLFTREMKQKKTSFVAY